MLQFHVMDAVAVRDHLRKIQDIERSLGIVRTSGALNDGVETQAHDRNAIQFSLIRALPPYSAGAGGKGGTNKKLSSFHDAYLALGLGANVDESIYRICARPFRTVFQESSNKHP
jgi:hypothetical protein